MKNRDRFEILNLILQIANGYNNVTMTKIMNRALLSYTQMKEYVNFLSEKAYLLMTANKEKYRHSRLPKKVLGFSNYMID